MDGEVIVKKKGKALIARDCGRSLFFEKWEGVRKERDYRLFVDLKGEVL